jgi:hypothetical protein
LWLNFAISRNVLSKKNIFSPFCGKVFSIRIILSKVAYFFLKRKNQKTKNNSQKIAIIAYNNNEETTLNTLIREVKKKPELGQRLVSK